MTRNDASRDPALTSRQAAALPLLVAGKTLTEAAAAGVASRRTLGRWIADPAFAAALAAARLELWAGVLDRVRGLLPQALDALEAELGGEGRLQAALGILRSAGLGKVLLDPAAADVEERLKALEEALVPTGRAGANGNGSGNGRVR